MEILHALASVLAAFRLTTLFTQDAIWNPVRLRLPSVPWHCSLCMSVWGGIAATVFLLTLPWLNWPLAVSWLYLLWERLRSPMDAKELEARVAAMQAEYELQAAALMRRSSVMAADLSSAHSQIREMSAKLEELEAKLPKEPVA